MTMSSFIVEKVTLYLKQKEYDFSKLLYDNNYSNIIQYTNDYFNINFPRISNDEKILIFSEIYTNYKKEKEEEQNMIVKEEDNNIKTLTIKEREEKQKEIMKESFNESNYLQKKIASVIDQKNINASNMMSKEAIKMFCLTDNEKISAFEGLIYTILYGLTTDTYYQIERSIETNKPINLTHATKFLEVLKSDGKSANIQNFLNQNNINFNNEIKGMVDGALKTMNNTKNELNAMNIEEGKDSI